jgi:hypothetical protein
MHGLGKRGFRGDGFHTAGHAHFDNHDETFRSSVGRRPERQAA